MPSTRVLKVAVTVLVVVLPVTGVVATVGEAGGMVALPHDEPENPDGNVTVLRGDGDLVGGIDDSTDLRRARATGSVRPTTHIVPGDLLVLQFRSEQMNGTFAESEGTNPTDRFFRMLKTSDLDLSVEGRNHGTGQLPAELSLNRSNVVVLHDTGNATFTLLVDTGSVALVDRDSGDTLRRDLDYLEFEAVVEIPTDDGGRRVLVGDSEFRPPAATVQSPDTGVHFQRTPATVRQNATGGFTVNATTTLLPGSNLTITAVTPNGRVLAEQRVRTQEPPGSNEQFGHSAFRTTLAVGPLEADEEFDLVVSRNEPIDERRVEVGVPPRMWNTTAELVTDGEHEGQIAVNTSLELPASGFLLVYIDGEPVTTPVPGDSQARPTMYVDRSAVDPERGEVYVLAVWDIDGDGVYDDSDRLFRTSVDIGASRQDSELDVSVPVEGWPGETSTGSMEPPSPTTTLTQAPTATARDATPSPSPPSTSTTTPGFGVLIAVVAAMSIVLNQIRRH